MKKFFTLLLATVISVSMFALDGSKLTISTVTNKLDLKIEIDGRRFSMTDNTMTLTNLQEGSHSVKIFREARRNGNGNGRGWGAGMRQDVIYNSSVFIKRGYHLDITVNRFGKAMVDERRIDPNDDWYDDDNSYNQGNDHDWENNYNNGMSVRDFDQFKESLRREWLESTRLSIAKMSIDRNSFSSQQVKEVVLLFTLENNKLDIAKYSYRNTTDKRNYSLVSDALFLSSSREELSRFVRDSR
jgi:hypothetical protein